MYRCVSHRLLIPHPILRQLYHSKTQVPQEPPGVQRFVRVRRVYQFEGNRRSERGVSSFIQVSNMLCLRLKLLIDSPVAFETSLQLRNHQRLNGIARSDRFVPETHLRSLQDVR